MSHISAYDLVGARTASLNHSPHKAVVPAGAEEDCSAARSARNKLAKSGSVVRPNNCMNRRVISRMFLSSLLMLQLGTSVAVRASPLQGGSLAAATQEHLHLCATRSGPAVEHGHDDLSASHSHSKLVAPPAKTGCCTHSTCACDCAGAVAVFETPVDGACVRSDHRAVSVFAAPLIEVRAFEFFRPPI